MELRMKTWLILVLLAALSWGLAAQNPTQQQFPTAPSATKFPPPQSAPPPPSRTSQPSTPAQSPAPPPASSQPSTSGASDKSGTASADRSTAKSDNPDDTLTVIRKRVDEVNVVFTVTDKRGHFVKDLTQNDFRVFDDAKPAESVRSF